MSNLTEDELAAVDVLVNFSHYHNKGRMKGKGWKSTREAALKAARKNDVQNLPGVSAVVNDVNEAPNVEPVEQPAVAEPVDTTLKVIDVVISQDPEAAKKPTKTEDATAKVLERAMDNGDQDIVISRLNEVLEAVSLLPALENTQIEQTPILDAETLFLQNFIMAELKNGDEEVAATKEQD